MTQCQVCGIEFWGGRNAKYCLDHKVEAMERSMRLGAEGVKLKAKWEKELKKRQSVSSVE